jgi:hypothetical protein
MPTLVGREADDLLDREPVRVDVRSRAEQIDDGGDDLLPVVAEGKTLLPLRFPLPGTVEGHRVVAARDRSLGTRPHRGHRTVAAVVEDHRWPWRACRIDGEEVALELRPLVGDLEVLDRRIAALAETVEAIAVLGPGRQQALRV